MRRVEDGWVLDEFREIARQHGATYIVTVGEPQEVWVSAWDSSGGPWVKRRQSTFYCARCQVVMSAGPDYWMYCVHNQPPPTNAVDPSVTDPGTPTPRVK